MYLGAKQIHVVLSFEPQSFDVYRYIFGLPRREFESVYAASHKTCPNKKQSLLRLKGVGNCRRCWRLLKDVLEM